MVKNRSWNIHPVEHDTAMKNNSYRSMQRSQAKPVPGDRNLSRSHLRVGQEVASWGDGKRSSRDLTVVGAQASARAEIY